MYLLFISMIIKFLSKGWLFIQGLGDFVWCMYDSDIEPRLHNDEKNSLLPAFNAKIHINKTISLDDNYHNLQDCYKSSDQPLSIQTSHEVHV